MGLLAGFSGGQDPAGFNPFMTDIDYQKLRIGEAVFQQKDYNRELNQMIEELSRPSVTSGMLTGTKGLA